MDDNTSKNARVHNFVLSIITVACIGAIVESLSQGWEFWAPPLIVIGLIAAWTVHMSQRGSVVFRENYYIIFSMLVSFFHGVHATSFFDVVVISTLLMVTITLFKRKELLTLILVEFSLIIIMQIYLALKSPDFVFDSLNISRIILHIVSMFCIYRVLCEVVKSIHRDSDELKRRNKEKEYDKLEMEDFLVNISHELRTPVNVINGLSTIILNKESRKDVESIRDAGLRLSSQIEDIQDYSEIQRGDVLLEEDRYMILSLLNDIIAEYNIKENNNGLELIVDLDPNVPTMLKGDCNKIRKIIRHLLSNAIKFTKRGGVYLKVSCIRHDYGLNLTIEVTDTGIGMSRKDIDKISEGIYQIDRRRNRSTGGIGLGLPIVYGFVRKMNGFVSIDSEKGRGTTVHVSIAQEIIEPAACLSVNSKNFINAVFHVIPGKYNLPEIREFYKNMATNISSACRVNLYFAPSITELKKLLERGNITHIFMGEEEYLSAHDFFDKVSQDNIAVAVSAHDGFTVGSDSRVIVMPKPIYAYPVVKILNGDTSIKQMPNAKGDSKPVLDGIKVLVVDDEPMNLVVASGIFKEYNMIVDTATSGKESLEKFSNNNYDIIFMDHMMPEMDGVEAMKRLKDMALQRMENICIIALTANAISGARQMFMREGFDGFISKPIDIADFERTMNRVLPSIAKGGDRV
ncbi:MAG: response regulator [Lachnospiraceae bacterium]|nr:response regulator [Lachnospiraceae bacterium]